MKDLPELVGTISSTPKLKTQMLKFSDTNGGLTLTDTKTETDKMPCIALSTTVDVFTLLRTRADANFHWVLYTIYRYFYQSRCRAV